MAKWYDKSPKSLPRAKRLEKDDLDAEEQLKEYEEELDGSSTELLPEPVVEDK